MIKIIITTAIIFFVRKIDILPANDMRILANVLLLTIIGYLIHELYQYYKQVSAKYAVHKQEQQNICTQLARIEAIKRTPS